MLDPVHRNEGGLIKRFPKAVLMLVGAEFADSTERGERGHRWAVEVMRVKAGPELHLAGVVDKANTSAMVLVAEPAVTVERTADGQLICTMHGWNEFNPVTGAARFRSTDKLPCLLSSPEAGEIAAAGGGRGGLAAMGPGI